MLEISLLVFLHLLNEGQRHFLPHRVLNAKNLQILVKLRAIVGTQQTLRKLLFLFLLKPREVKILIQGHIACKEQSKAWSPGYPTQELCSGTYPVLASPTCIPVPKRSHESKGKGGESPAKCHLVQVWQALVAWRIKESPEGILLDPMSSDYS